MTRLVRWLLTDSSAGYAEPRTLPDLSTRVERGIASLLDCIQPSR